MFSENEQHSPLLLKPLRVAPRSFKRQLEVVLHALAHLRLRTTLFAKLPKGNSWLADLEHHSQTLGLSAAHLFLFQREHTATTAPWFTPVPIAEGDPMRGEYFLLAVADRVGVLVVGQRETATYDDAAPSEEVSSPGEPESLPQVAYRITFQKPLIQQKLEALHPTLELSLAQNPSQPALQRLLAEWRDRTQVPEAPLPALMDVLLMQCGEDHDFLQQRARAFRRQAMTASSLSTQNEALLNTLRLKDDFLNTVGQELRTPLSTIKTALPLLSSPNLKPPQRQRYLDMISRECDRQVNLINGLLELLQIERSLPNTKPDPVNPFDVLPGVVSTYQPLAQEKGIRLAYTVPNSLPPVCCPEAWLRQIMIHLLNNSIRYTQPGGEVWVTAQVEDADTLSVQVRDTGVGISQQELPHIFNHFYRGRQANAEEEGVGLGLAIVQQLLLYCGGRISVESQPEVGSHFKVFLPLYHP